MKKTSLIIALSAILPGIASAGAPVQYGQWGTNATGGITLTGTGAGGCPAGMTCSASPVTDVGFQQTQMTDGAGNTYFQTVIADEGSSNQAASAMAFQSESFVKSGTSNGGIASLQTMNITDSQGTAAATAALSTGDFNNGTGFNADNSNVTVGAGLEHQVVLSQDVNNVTGGNPATFHNGFGFYKNGTADTGTLGASGTHMTMNQQVMTTDSVSGNKTFALGVAYQQDNNSNGDELGVALDIAMGVSLRQGTTADPHTTSSINDQAFVLAQRTGDYANGGTVNIAGSLSPSPVVVTEAGSSGTTNGTAANTYAETDMVSIGQTIAGAGVFGYGDANSATFVGGSTTPSTTDGMTNYSLATTSVLTRGTTDPFVSILNASNNTNSNIVSQDASTVSNGSAAISTSGVNSTSTDLNAILVP